MSSGYVILLNVVLFPLPSCFGSAGELWLSGLFLSSPAFQVASLVAQLVKNLPAMWETWVRSLGWEDPLEKGKATPIPVFWPGEFHGLYIPWDHKESDTAERLSLHCLQVGSTPPPELLSPCSQAWEPGRGGHLALGKGN